jgi:hypothetical protein
MGAVPKPSFHSFVTIMMSRAQMASIASNFSDLAWLSRDIEWKRKSNDTTSYTPTRSEELQAQYLPFILS